MNKNSFKTQGINGFSKLILELLKINFVKYVRWPKNTILPLEKYEQCERASTNQIAIFQTILHSENLLWKLNTIKLKNKTVEQKILDTEFRLRILRDIFKKITPVGDYIVKGKCLYKAVSSPEDMELAIETRRSFLPGFFPKYIRKTKTGL